MLVASSQHNSQEETHSNYPSMIPEDKCCLVVQMPSVEEMRKNVTDITYQMQSVYIGRDKTNQLDKVTNKGQMSTDENPVNNIQNSPNRRSSLIQQNSLDSDCNEAHQHSAKANTLGSVLEHTNYDNWPTVSNASTNSLTNPREELVSEEFVINGKRYRQSYRRRVVLERRTTRDVFFLIGNNRDCEKLKSDTKQCFEYCSPNFDQPLLSTSNDAECDSTDQNNSRPLIDLEVLHPTDTLLNNDSYLSPTVVMHPTKGSQPIHLYKGSLDRSQVKNDFNLPKPLIDNRIDNTVSSEVNCYSASNQDPSTSVIQSDASNTTTKNTSQSKHFMQTIKRSFRRGILRRTQSSTNKPRPVILTDEYNKRPVTHLISNLESNPIEAESKQVKSKEIIGYMYKFGAWDNQQPVLDPRLHQSVSPISNDQIHSRSVVIPTEPEWHHVEIGMENSDEPADSYLRGRTVACLQRFTQQSATSGKPLHRSTYVQQTKLVRHVNKQLPESETITPSQSELKESNKDNITDRELRNGNFVNDDNKIAGVEENAELASKFIKCTNERLDLLQSICPASAAATILLSKPIRYHSHSPSDSDSDIENNDKEHLSDESRMIVTASSWCPNTLRNNNPTAGLVFNTHSENNVGSSNHTTTNTTTNNITNNNNTNQNSCSWMSDTSKLSHNCVALPELTIRGGSIDSLLLYAIKLLQNPDQTDYLLPDVLRVTYITFTTSEKIIERLIQIYIAFAPIEPGCLSTDWSHALTAAKYLLRITEDLTSNQFTPSLVLRLARFMRLLNIDNELAKGDQTNGHHDHVHGSLLFEDHMHQCIIEKLQSKLPFCKINQKCCFPASIKLTKKVDDTASNHLDEHNNTKNRQFINAATDSRGQVNNYVEMDGVVTQQSQQSNSLPKKENNNDSDEQLLSEWAKDFMQFDECSIAEQLTQLEEERFAQISFNELLDISRLEKGEAHTISACVEHFNKTTHLAKTLLFIIGPMLDKTYAKTNVSEKKQYKSVTVQHLLPNLYHFTRRSFSQKRDKITNQLNKLAKLKRRSSFNFKSSTNDTNNVDFNFKNSQLCRSDVGSEMPYSNAQKFTSLNRMFMKLCDVLRHLKQMKNFSSYLAILLAIQEVPDFMLPKKAKGLLDSFSAYMTPPNFVEYRRDLEASSLPCLPYLGLIFQQLIHLHTGNSIYLQTNTTTNIANQCSNVEKTLISDKLREFNNHTSAYSFTPPLQVITDLSVTNTDNVINIWRCWKHYLILGYFIKRKEGTGNRCHTFKPDTKIRSILIELYDKFSDQSVDLAKDHLSQSKLELMRKFHK